MWDSNCFSRIFVILYSSRTQNHFFSSQHNLDLVLWSLSIIPGLRKTELNLKDGRFNSSCNERLDSTEQKDFVTERLFFWFSIKKIVKLKDFLIFIRKTERLGCPILERLFLQKDLKLLGWKTYQLKDLKIYLLV